MELFSEVYGLYYRIAAEILNKAPLTQAEAHKIVADSGFAESVLQLVPQLLESRTWPLLEKREGRLFSRLRHPVRVPVTLLELRWLKAVLADPRARLFLADSEIARLEIALFDVPPLYDGERFHYFDRCRDGDSYYSYAYIRNFRRILRALREKSLVRICYRTGAHSCGVQERTGSFLPLKLEYSEKDDKFRIHCAHIRYGRLIRYATINLGRVLDTADSMERYEGEAEIEGWFSQARCKEPVVVDVYPERNAVERFLLEFSSFEKQSVFDAKTGVCQVRIWYPAQDGTEVLIRILGFGPAVHVRSPEQFVRQLRERVANQSRLLAAERARSWTAEKPLAAASKG